MAAPVIAIGLDSADRTLYERWMNEGRLKSLSRLRRAGTFVPLTGLPYANAEAGWACVLSGVFPEKYGFWSPLRFNSGNYAIEQPLTYSYEEYPPFYALGESYNVAAFDIPQTRLSQDVNGIQVLAYGAHSPQTPRISQPEGLLKKLIKEFGDHPAIQKDFARLWRRRSMATLRRRLIKGAEIRGDICRDLLESEKWDLFFTVFGEFHSAGHHMWHLSQDDHPLHDVFKGQLGNQDPLLEVAETIDTAIGKIFDAAPSDATIVVFSQEGMAPNNLDLPSMLFLPEILYRWSFPGRWGFVGGPPGLNEPPPRMITHPFWMGWTRGVWSLKYDENRLRSLARRYLPLEMGRLVEKIMGTGAGPGYPKSFKPYFQVPIWYSPYWPRMKAFGLPSFSDGYIRINLRGREASGIVHPSEYDAVCDEISQHLRAVTNARTGRPIVQDIIRTRSSPTDRSSGKICADLVVIWDTDPADVIDSPLVGRIGPIPHKRTGGHNSDCFLIAAGPRIAAGNSLPAGRLWDIAPTIVSLVGAPVSDRFDSKPLNLS